MGIGEFYTVPEIDLRRANHDVLGSYVSAKRSMDKALWLGKQWEEDLAGRRPEELPPCFLAVQADGLSPRTGWATEHGRWEPIDLFTSPGSRLEDIAIAKVLNTLWMKTTLVFRPNDGSKSDLTMTMYNEISTSGRYFLEEDIALCHVFRVPKGKRNGVVHSEPSQLRYGFVDEPFNEIPNIDLSGLVEDFPDFVLPKGKGNGVVHSEPCQSPFGFLDDPVNEFPKLDLSGLNVEDFLDLDVEGNGVGGWDLPSVDSFGGTKKRQRPNTKPVGGSEAWHSFIKIYTKDPKVVYAACNHCGRMFRLKGGSTSSLLKHSKTCHKPHQLPQATSEQSELC